MGDTVDFLSADKHKIFLKVDSIILEMCRQECPKYSKQQLCNIFAISQGNIKDGVEILSADKHQRYLQTSTIILGVCGQAFLRIGNIILGVCGKACLNYPN